MTNSNESQATGLLEVFTFNQNSTPIRVQVINNEPWFNGNDIANVLGYSNPRDALSKHCKTKGVAFCDTLTEGGVQKLKYINEGNLYRLIVNSNMPKAEEFESWIFDEVLPTIRKKGYYGIKKQTNDYLDARDIPYTKQFFNGSEVRCIVIEGEKWLSLNDFHVAIGSRTGSGQAVKKLNVKSVNARKIHIFGNTHPAWFVTVNGAKLLLSCSRKLQSEKQLMLEFVEA